MNGVWGIVIATAIGAVAWIYQRAWERQQLRVARYQAIVDRLHGFTQAQLDPDKIEQTLIEIRRLWLFAPNDVVRAANAFLEAVEKREVKRPALAKFILAMRRDASFASALVPRFFRNTLKENEVADIKIANRQPGAQDPPP